MNCQTCGRTLSKDARYCDFCGTKVHREQDEMSFGGDLNKSLLIKGIVISLGVSVAITLIAMGFGLPLFFGGLFLPFFFIKKKKKTNH